MDISSNKPNIINLYSYSFREIIPQNTPGNFKNYLRTPFHFSKPTLLAIRAISYTEGFFNIVKEQIIELLITNDDQNFEKVAICKIPQGYYSTLDALITTINVNMVAVTQYSEIDDVPLFEILRPNTENCAISITIPYVHRYEMHENIYIKKQYRLCMNMPQLFIDELGFESLQIRQQNIVSTNFITFPSSYNRAICVHTDLTGDTPLGKLPQDTTIIDFENNFSFFPIKESYLKKDITSVSVYFTDPVSKKKLPKYVGEVFVSLIFKEAE